MDNLNNIPNVGNWGDAASKLNDNFNKIKQAVTTVENTSKNNKGYFTSLSALNTAFPSPKAGQTAYVYGEASSTKYYIYNAVNGAWVASSIEAPAVGVDMAGYAKTGGSTKTLKEVDDSLNRGGFDNLFNHIDGQLGSIQSGVDMPAVPENTRYRSNFFRVNVDGIIDISIEDEYHFVVVKYDLNKKYISVTAPYTTTYNVTEDAFYRIIVKRKDSAILSDLDIKNIHQSVYVFLLYKDSYKIKDLVLSSVEKIQQIGGLNYSENAPVEININERIFQGSYYDDSYKPWLLTRLVSDAIETIPFNKLTINCNSDFLFVILFQDERDNTVFTSGYMDSFSGIIPHKYFRIIIKRKDEANISLSDIGDVGLVITQSEVNYISVSASSAGTSVSSDSYLNSILKEVYLNIEEYDPLKRYWLEYINFVDGQLTTLFIAKTDLDGSNLERILSFRFKDLTQSGLFSNADGTILFEKNNFNGLINADNKVELSKNIFDINTQPTIKRFNKGGRWSDFLENSKILSAKTFGRIVKENEGVDIFVMPFTSDLHSAEKYANFAYYRGFTWMYADLISYLTETYNCDASANLGDVGFDAVDVDNINTLMAQVGRASQTSKPFFFSVGNHETFANQPNSLNSKMFTHSLRKPTYEKFEMNTSNSNIYCEYYDDTNKNVRIITLNTYLGRTIYIPYLVNALSTTPDDYSILILQHEPPYVEISALPNVDIDYAEERQILEDFVAKRAGVSTNSTYDFSSQNSKIAGLLCGHIHESIGKTINGVNVYATGGLGMAGNYAAVGARDENMMLGIDIFADIAVINSSNSTLKIYRVGKNDIDGSVDVEFTF